MRRIWLSLALVLFVTPVLALSKSPYVTTAEIDLTTLLPPPPAKGSPAQAADIAAVLAAQRSRTPAQATKVEKDAVSTVFQFADVLGPAFNQKNLPKLNAFFVKVIFDGNGPSAVAKDKWARPRPYEADPAIKPPGNMIQTTISKMYGTPTYSYPSGHSAFGVICAILLSEMVPEKRAQLFARGWELGTARIVGGVHFPTDVEAGRINGTLMAALMMQKPVFRADLEEAKAELRKVLKLPR